MPFPEKEREVLLSFMNALLESCENLLLASVTLGNGSFGVCHSQGELPLLDTCQTCLGAPWDPCALHCKAGEAQTAQMQYSYSGQFGFFVEMLAPRAGAPFDTFPVTMALFSQCSVLARAPIHCLFFL